MLVATKALVISSLKYGESDLIVSCFTESDGLKSYMLRGILKSKKGRLKKALFQPLTQLEIVANHKNKGTLERINEAKVYFHYSSLHTNIVKSSLVLFLAEMLKNAIQEEEKNEHLYEYIESAFQWLDIHDESANFHILFLLKLTMFLGFYPDTTNIKKTYFNLLEGTFENETLTPYSISGENIENFKQFFGINFDKTHSIKLNKKSRFEVLNLLLQYYQLHLQNYKTPKSLLVLKELFS